MSLNAMSLANYKCFDARQVFEIRPITVLLGKNNSGKSALARLPLLLATGLRTESAEPLDTFALGADVGGTFVDLIHGKRPHGSLEFSLSLESSALGHFNIGVEIQNLDEYGLQVVSHFEATSDDMTLSLAWDLQNPRADAGTRRYAVRWQGTQSFSDVSFHGILPRFAIADEVPAEATEFLEQVVSSAEAALDEVRYLGPFRDQPARFYRTPSRLPTDLGSQGQFAPDILAMDEIRSAGKVLDRVNTYMAQSVSGWKLAIETSAGTYSLVLTPAWDNTQGVNLVDTGTGIAQVLPIYIQRALDESAPLHAPLIEIVEQPELHLHPSAHAQLADLYLSSCSDSHRFIIETHSETFLLRLRRRVAAGELNSGDLAIYFIESRDGSSSIRRILVGDSGELDYWPAGVFAEDFEETKALAAEQLRRQATDAS